MTVESIPAVLAHAIQLAVAPVFLLTGLAGLLGVMATRLARVIDRARWLAAEWPRMSEAARADGRAELRVLERRRHLASWAINQCTCAALLVCLVVVALFVEEVVGGEVRVAVAVLFSGTMLLTIGGLATFLREVYIATHATVIDAALLDRELAQAQRDGTRITP